MLSIGSGAGAIQTKLHICYHMDAWWLVNIFMSEIYFTVLAVTDVLCLRLLVHPILYIAQFLALRTYHITV